MLVTRKQSSSGITGTPEAVNQAQYGIPGTEEVACAMMAPLFSRSHAVHSPHDHLAQACIVMWGIVDAVTVSKLTPLDKFLSLLSGFLRYHQQCLLCSVSRS